jgi:ABC-type branched-subunit amino acid transport system substrate-binding protein
VPGALILAGGEEHLAALQADREAGNGLYLATTYVTDGATPQNQSFARDYQERFHEAPDVNAALAYDGVRLLLEAARRVGVPTPSQVRTEVAGFMSAGFDSLTGTLTFDQNHSARRPLYVGRLQDGQLKVIKRYDPDAR